MTTAREVRQQQGGSSSTPAGGRRPLRILLIEDSRADADLLVDFLSDEMPGAFVTVTQTLAAAVPLLQEPLDIAITDLSLPDAQGLESLTAILHARPDIAVVVMTGRRDLGFALQALSEGAEDYLIKGVHDAKGVATAVLFAAERRGAEDRAHRFERLALSLLDAMESSTCAVDRDGIIIAVNKAWRDCLLRNESDPAGAGIGLPYLSVCAAAGGPDAASAHEVASGLGRLLSGEIARFEAEYPTHSRTGDRWMSVRANALPESGAVLNHVDVTTMKQAEQALAHLNLHDPLTDLPNRQLLSDRVVQALALTERSGRHVAVAFVDVDQFKHVNDSFGHAAGDELLCAIAGRLGGHVRPGDTVARFSGDEFVVVWPGIASPGEAQLLAERVTDAMRAPFVLRTAAATVTVTVSVGLAVGCAPQQMDDLLLEADAAMYYAKGQGRGLIHTFTEQLRTDATARLRDEDELRRAVENREFVLHYQPVVDLKNRTVVAVEALVRWDHPEGMRMPDTFIPLAEATGIMIPLGAWVLAEACRQHMAWAAQGLDLQIAVNLSSRQMEHPGVVDLISQTLEDSGMSPEDLWVEVTESAVFSDAEHAKVVVNRIKALGCSIAIDDFGTGYSTLVYLKHYPAMALKADRQFIAGLGTQPVDDAIVASLVQLAHAIGAVCVAEGVETLAQQNALLDLSCDYAQGFLYSRPVPAGGIRTALQGCADVLSSQKADAVQDPEFRDSVGRPATEIRCAAR